MMLGEAGADYVGFEIDAGQPDDPDGLDMIRWWAEIFEVPCVALGIATEAQVLAAAGTGADFFALHLRNGLAAGEAAALIRSAAAALAAPRGSG
jgi:thiamine-phosphate pyrophosphorylase